MIFTPVYLRRRSSPVTNKPVVQQMRVKESMRHDCLMALAISDELMSIDLMACLRRARRIRDASFSLIQLGLRCSTEEARRLEYKICKRNCRNLTLYKSGIKEIIDTGRRRRRRQREDKRVVFTARYSYV